MKQKYFPLIVLFSCVLFVFHFNSAAQSENELKDTIRIKNNLFLNTLPPEALPFSMPLSPTLNKIQLLPDKSPTVYQFTPQPKQVSTFSFSQAKIESEIPSIGFSRQFNNTLTYQGGNKLVASAGIGLVHQNSVLNAHTPNYQLNFQAYLEYELTDWLSAYFHGQYVTPSLTVDNKFVDPLMLWSPIFEQTEIGTGLQAKYKKVKLDIGMKKTFNTQIRDYGVKSMHSKLILGF